MAPTNASPILPLLLACSLALSGCISTGSDLRNYGTNDNGGPARVESLSVAAWGAGQGEAPFDVPDGYDYVLTTYSQGGQTFGTSSYTYDGDKELDGGPAATHAGGFQLVRTAPAVPGPTTFTSPYAMGGGQFTATAYDNVDATLLLALAWGGSRADTFVVDTRFGFYAPEGPSELTITVQSGGGQTGTITLEAPDGSTRTLAGPAGGGSQGVSTIPNAPGVWTIHVGGMHNGGNQVTISAVPEVDDITDWF